MPTRGKTARLSSSASLEWWLRTGLMVPAGASPSKALRVCSWTMLPSAHTPQRQLCLLRRVLLAGHAVVQRLVESKL